MEASGVRWDAANIARFLFLCEEVEFHDAKGNPKKHLLWRGAKSRGRGNTAWYGTFSAQGKSVRAHKFYAVAVLGLRPRTGVHHLDHTCPDSLCVSCLQLEVEAINLKLRWVRAHVGLDEDKVRGEIVEYLAIQEPEWFDNYDPVDFEHYITDEHRWRFGHISMFNRS